MGGSGKTKSTTTVNVPDPTFEERLYKALGSAIGVAGLQDMGYDFAYGNEGEVENPTFVLPAEVDRWGRTKKGSTPLAIRIGKRAPTEEEALRAQRNKALEDKFYEQLMGNGLSSEDRANIDTIYDEQIRRGQGDILTFAQQQAAQRGMSLTDSPIGKDALRAGGDLMLGMNSARAGAYLNKGQSNQIFGQELRNFQEQLKQQAFANRAGISEQFLQSGLGLGRMRYGSAGQSTVSSQPSGLQNTLLGGGLGALGSIGAGFAFSSRTFKEDIEPYSLETILDEIEATPVYSWRYKSEFGDPRTHVGPVTEESPRAIVTEDGRALVTLDYLGYMFGAIKALTQRVKELESRNA